MTSRFEPGPVHQPEWLHGRGVGPRLIWSRGTDGKLLATALARETGELYFCDSSPALYRLSRHGQIIAKAPLPQQPVLLDWSDDGSAGAIVLGDDLVLRVRADLQVEHEIQLPDTCLSIAVSPFGNHLITGLASGLNLVFNERKRRLAQFQTLRPLAFIRCCISEPILFAAADHGLICCHDLQGGEIWQERSWSNVGSLEICGAGDLLYLAALAHGVQVLDGDGGAVGSYILEGTVHRASVTYEPGRILAATVERQLYWLDSDGELLWSTLLPDDVVSLHCDPLGERAVVGLKELGIYALAWDV